MTTTSIDSRDILSLIPFFYQERDHLFFILDNGTPFQAIKSEDGLDLQFTSHYTIENSEEIKRKLAYFDQFFAYHHKFKQAAISIRSRLVDKDFQLISGRQLDPMQLSLLSQEYAGLQVVKRYVDEIVELLEVYKDGLRRLLVEVSQKIEKTVVTGEDSFTPANWIELHQNYWKTKRDTAQIPQVDLAALNSFFGVE